MFVEPAPAPAAAMLTPVASAPASDPPNESALIEANDAACTEILPAAPTVDDWMSAVTLLVIVFVA